MLIRSALLSKCIFFRTLGVLVTFLSLFSCSNKGDTENHPQTMLPEFYHADNDIAMTVRSLVDAIKVGEPIDSVDYDFVGVLTDGQGAPLYTDILGAPGKWVVDVLDTGHVSIKNLEIGDLLPGHLKTYILQTLGMKNSLPIDVVLIEDAEDDETDISVYDIEGGYLRFETRAGEAANGIEGPYVTIILSVAPPPGVETQTDALAHNVAKP